MTRYRGSRVPSGNHADGEIGFNSEDLLVMKECDTLGTIT
jgi:hypothetical protein